MNRSLYTLLGAQFLSAFADNAVLFTAIAMALDAPRGDGYVPLLQACFLAAFVFLAPWVGPYADRRPKGRVLVDANVVKGAGALLLLFGVEPLLAYALIGVGAAIYSPAKYGILPELVGHERLVKANGWLEGATILAILTGSLAGARVAEGSVPAALWMILACYLVSGLMALFIRSRRSREGHGEAALPTFVRDAGVLVASHRARFALLGVALFWSAAAVLRVALVAWAPLALAITTPSEIAGLTLYTAVGIAVGALLAPRLIPLERLPRARFAAYAMGGAILLLGPMVEPWSARALLFLAGTAGGIFVVPINAALQEVGHATVGSGKAVALQSFFENLAMLAATGLYAWGAGAGLPPVPALLVLGVAVVASTHMTVRLSRRALVTGEMGD